MKSNDIEVAAENRAKKRRWAVEAKKRIDTLAGVLSGVDDPAADEAYRALVARIATIVEG